MIYNQKARKRSSTTFLVYTIMNCVLKETINILNLINSFIITIFKKILDNENQSKYKYPK